MDSNYDFFSVNFFTLREQISNRIPGIIKEMVSTHFRANSYWAYFDFTEAQSNF